MNSLSVVIPSYNSAATLGACLKALARELDWRCDEVIVVDSSSDPVPGAFLAEFPRVQWERRPNRLFPGAARNIGFRLARSEWVAFLDADIMVGSSWRNAIHRLSSSMVAAGGPIEPALPHTDWGLVRYWIEFGQFSERNFPQQSWNIPSCNMIWLHSAFKETGGFPEDFLSADDLLFNFDSMKLRNRQFVLLAELKVSHPADYNMRATQEHLRNLGYWSARARLAGVPPFPARSVLSLPLVYLYRYSQVWRRCLRATGQPGMRSLALPMARGAAWWCEGFYAGLRESR